MKLFKGVFRFLKGLSIKKNPRFLVIYGNYGGAMYSGRTSYDENTGQLYKLDDNGNFVFVENISPDNYFDLLIDIYRTNDQIDELDCCFKLHDMDTNTNNISDIIKASHSLPVNMGHIDPVFYLGYPVIFIIGVTYFSIIASRKINPSDRLLNEIKEYRLTCQNVYRKKFSINFV